MASAALRTSSRLRASGQATPTWLDVQSLLAFPCCHALGIAGSLSSVPAMSRGVHLTTESSELREAASAAPPSSLHSSDELYSMKLEREVVRPLYKAVLGAVRQLDGEFLRYKSRQILSAADLAWLQDNAPGALAAIRQGPGPQLEELVVAKFREPLSSDEAMHPSEMKKELGSRLDTGLAALALLSKRLRLLRDHAPDQNSECLTQGIRVCVESHFSTVDHRLGAVFHYTVKLRNESHSEPVQLISRHWVITEFDGRNNHVIGPGVIGQQPILETGEEYTYSSFSTLNSKRGTQRGSFSMLGLNSKELFDVQIAPFGLVPGS